NPFHHQRLEILARRTHLDPRPPSAANPVGDHLPLDQLCTARSVRPANDRRTIRGGHLALPLVPHAICHLWITVGSSVFCHLRTDFAAHHAEGEGAICPISSLLEVYGAAVDPIRATTGRNVLLPVPLASAWLGPVDALGLS